MKDMKKRTFLLCIFAFMVINPLSTVKAQENLELKSNIFRAEIKSNNGDKIPDPIEIVGQFGVLINESDKVISIITNNAVSSTVKIINIESINNSTIYLYVSNQKDINVLVVTDTYYYILFSNTTFRFTIKK